MAGKLKPSKVVPMEEQLMIFLTCHEKCGDRCDKHSIKTCSLLRHGLERSQINYKRGLIHRLKTEVAWSAKLHMHHIQHRVHLQLGQSGDFKQLCL